MPAVPAETPASQLISDIASCSRDPLRFVKYAYSWGEGSIAEPGPRDWQARILTDIRDHLSDPSTRYTPLRIAVASGHGVGKSAVVAMLIDWAMSTCEDCKAVLTANTEPQLRTKTWPEVQKWTRMAINAHWFQRGATSLTIKDPGHERIWRADMIAWSENNTEAFSGLHNLGKRILVIFDEASAIANAIWDVTEGALTDEGTEILWFVFGNPTMNTGRFRECFGRSKHRWRTYQIDSRNVIGTNKAQIDQWIADYGDDSDFVRVRVKGEFPRSGTQQFISSEDVAKCRKYKAEGYERLPKILSVDVARYGDDQTVIGLRQGRRAVILGKHRGLSTTQTAERVIEHIAHETPDAVVVDGVGVGAGVVDQLHYRGYGQKLFEFNGGEAANDWNMYFNRRAEVWGLMRDWLRAGAEIPDDPEVESDLTGTQYGFSSKNQIQLEKKEELKKRGLASPDIGDCFSMSFAVNIKAKYQEARKPEYRYPGQLDNQWMGG